MKESGDIRLINWEKLQLFNGKMRGVNYAI